MLSYTVVTPDLDELNLLFEKTSFLFPVAFRSEKIKSPNVLVSRKIGRKVYQPRIKKFSTFFEQEL